ncbi:MAG TPA: MFS transporter [Streptosporangiaceae bacterium]|nr:MFS transporter [Streptosporangiaceae bacterium]
MRKFAVLCAGYLISLTGSGLSGFALGVWIYLRTHSATMFAVSMVLTLLPGLLLSPLAGALADRWSRRMILLTSDLAGIVTTLSLAVLYALGLLEPWHVFIVITIRSALRSVQVPALNSSVVLLAPKKHVGRANGMVLLATAISQTVAPVLGGVLILAIRLTGVLLIDCATFVVNVVVLLLITIPRPAASEAGSAGKGTLRGEITQGWTYLSRRSGLVGLVVFYAALNLSVGFVDVLFTPLVLGFASVAALGTVLSVGGVGLILGGSAMTVWGGPRRRIHGLAGFAVPLGLFLCLGALRPNVTLIAIAAFGFMFCTMIIDGTSRSVLQVEVEPDMQGRTFAMFNMVTNFVLLVSYLIAGPIAQHIFDPLLREGGALAGNVGAVLGVGPARGTALLVLLLGLLILVTATVGYLHPSLHQLTARGENGDRVLALSVPEAFPGAATGQVMPADGAPALAADLAAVPSRR